MRPGISPIDYRRSIRQIHFAERSTQERLWSIGHCCKRSGDSLIALIDNFPSPDPPVPRWRAITFVLLLLLVAVAGILVFQRLQQPAGVEIQTPPEWIAAP